MVRLGEPSPKVTLIQDIRDFIELPPNELLGEGGKEVGWEI